MDPSETIKQAQARLLSSIRRADPPSFPPYYDVFHNAHNVRWNLIDENNKNRLSLVNDVLGVGQNRTGLSWDDIAACREQEMVAAWLDNEIRRETNAILQSVEDADQLMDEIMRAIVLDRIESPRTIFHVAALHNNIPLYRLFVEHGFFGQDSRYDSSMINHVENGVLPWELARTISVEIGTYAATQYLATLPKDTSSEL
jgi:hypothetical protein